jgi:SAM-dependent methyltransferase
MSATAPNINNVFFEGLYKDVWRKLIPAGLSEVEVDFMQEVGSLKEGDKVLDLMCGYGRHALELGRRGLKVTAIDNLPDYIEEISSIVQKEGLPVETLVADTLDAPLTGTYDLAVCMGNSFAFFDREDATELLKKVSGHLKPGGIFIINSWMIAEIAIKHFKEREWLQVGEYKYLMDYKFHFNPSRIESEHTILRNDGKVEVIRGIDYIFTLAELDAMFQEAGLRTKDLYSTPKKKKFSMGNNTVYIIAEKATD